MPKTPLTPHERFLKETCKRTIAMSGTLYHTGSGEEYRDFVKEFAALRKKWGVTDHALTLSIIRKNDQLTEIYKD